MSCTELRSELVTYHFGETALDRRAQVEEHLLACGDCLRDFLSVKCEIETADLAERPSQRARERLRRAVATEVAPETVARAWSWWERPAAFVCAGATVLAAIFLLHMVSTGPSNMPHSLDETPQTIDQPTR